jgi:tetratricopeptide (TPR) repeat protein
LLAEFILRCWRECYPLSVPEKTDLFLKSALTVRCGRIFAAACLFTIWTPSAFAQDEKGCEGVGFARQPPAQYSPESLEKRLKRNPADVDALINLGLHLEEQDQDSKAYKLYERAIQASPGCSLGYMFAGLAEERISGDAASDAEAKLHKALSLDPSLRNDPNVQGFFRRHPRPVLGGSSKETQSPSVTNDLLGSANRFLIGVGVGLLLATPFVYLARRKRTA